MKVILFGATGMVGQGALRACLDDPRVTSVLAVGRTPLGVEHPKLRELSHRDFTDFSAVEAELAGYDACLFCLGASSVGMSEADYRRVTYDFTLAAARALAKVNPGMKFLYVSGAGTDASEKGRVMWARVKGETENAALALPLDAFMLRPGYIQPVGGVTSKTGLYRAAYAVASPLFSFVRAVSPSAGITSAELGQAMINIAEKGAPKRVLESRDLVAIARGAAPAA